MKITSFITSIELAYFYPQSTDYTTDEINNALSGSCGLVMSYLNSNLSLTPPYEKDGNGSYPEILKINQAQFARWILETSNVGYTDELQNLYNATADVVGKISQNEITIPSVKHYGTETGWKISKIINSGSLGYAYLKAGQVPTSPTQYKLVCTSVGTNYVDSNAVTFNVYTDYSASPICTCTATYLYNNIISNYSGTISFDSLDMMFIGQWTNGDIIYVNGVPAEMVNANKDDLTLKQGYILY